MRVFNSSTKPKPWKEISSVSFILFPNDPWRGAVFLEGENITFAHREKRGALLSSFDVTASVTLAELSSWQMLVQAGVAAPDPVPY